MNFFVVLLYLFQKKSLDPMIDVDVLKHLKQELNPKGKFLYYLQAIYYAYHEVEINHMVYLFIKRYLIPFLFLLITCLWGCVAFNVSDSELVRIMDNISTFYNDNTLVNIAFILSMLSFFVILILYMIVNYKYNNISKILEDTNKIIDEYLEFLQEYYYCKNQKLFYEWLNANRIKQTKKILNLIKDKKIFTTPQFRTLLKEKFNNIFNILNS